MKPIVFPVPKRPKPLPPYDFPQGFAGGQNISVSPDQIGPSQSPNMSDVNYDDGGVITKRYGFSRVTTTSWGITPVQGTHEFWKIGATASIFLVAHGGKLYSYNETTDAKTNLCTGSVLSFADAPVAFFDMGNKCFFLTGNEYLYYDGTNPVATVQSIAKIPITALGKHPDGTAGTPNEAFNHISQFWQESFDPNGVATEFVCDKQYLDDGVTLVTLSANLFKAYLYGVLKTEGTDFSFDRALWKATFSVAPGFALDVDTLQIQLEATNIVDPTVITKCCLATEAGGKNNSLIFMAGNPSYPNTVRYSWVYDPTYLPMDSDFNVGGDSLPITGWGRMGEYLITYKQPGDQSLQWYSSINLDTLGNISFETNQLNDEYGCIAPRTVHPARDGLLALSDQGVIWTVPSLVKGQANCKMISRNINGRNGIAPGLLDNTQADLKAAHAEMYHNKYLLHVKDQVWVLDLDYSDFANNLFCWYPYSGIYGNAGLFMTRNQTLYIGDKTNGLIYKEQQFGDDVIHSDDGVAIDAWWTSSMIFLGGRERVKKFEKINLTFKASHGTAHTLTLYSDGGPPEEIPLPQEAGFFDARYFDAEYFNAGSDSPNYPQSQPEKIGVKGSYFQFKIRNNMLNRGLTMLAAMITFSLGKQV